jgi:uracil-DNA glycosylase
MRARDFVTSLSALSFSNTFNPYANRCPVHDKVDAPQRRSRLLTNMLEAANQQDIDAIWIGRDLGYRGGRRTGLALTDDVHMARHAFRWGVEIERPTKGAPVAERTAAVIWSILEQIALPIFLWNVFPLHPHDSENPFSNRSHNSREREAGEELLSELIRLLAPSKLVGIGNDAAKSLSRVSGSRPVFQVRHPSYGGQTDFLREVSEIYKGKRNLLL